MTPASISKSLQLVLWQRIRLSIFDKAIVNRTAEIVNCSTATATCAKTNKTIELNTDMGILRDAYTLFSDIYLVNAAREEKISALLSSPDLIFKP